MGKPAARLGDMTAHGGSITGPGVPTVLIGGMPAATLGDMHVCPMVTPGTPPIPHVGGPITLGSAGVLIGGKPAARLGDSAVCVGPPSTIVMGCMTVLIGETGSGSAGGGGSGGGGGGGGGSVASGAVTSASIAGQVQSNQVDTHYIDFTFEDKAKLAVGGLHYVLTFPDSSKNSGVLGGQIKRSGVPQGNYTVELQCIVDAQWSVKEAQVGTAVDLKVETTGVADGEKAMLEIYVRDGNYADHLLEVIEKKVSGDKVEAQWTMQVDDKYLAVCDAKSKQKKFSSPYFFFKVTIGDLCERSGLLYISDWVEFVVKDSKGKLLSNRDCVTVLSNGTIQKGKLDNDGKVRIQNVQPGKIEIKVDLRDN